MGKKNLSHWPGCGPFIWPFKHSGWNYRQQYQTWEFCSDIRKQFLLLLTGPSYHLMGCTEIIWRAKSIETLIYCQKIIIDEVIGVIGFVWSENLMNLLENLRI